MNIKQQTIQLVKELGKERYVAVLLAVLLLLCLMTTIYLIFQIHPSDLQVVVHYTGFGPTNFYRDKWYYLLSFVVFIIMFAFVHTIATYKLLQRRGRDFAAAFVWFSIIILGIGIAIFYQILKIASLS